MVFVCLGMNAKTFQPIIFDDPTFDIHSTQISPEQRSFFNQYTYAMERIEAGEDAEQFFVVERTDADKSVGPLLGDINFNQEAPYNNKCPYLNGGRAVTGCVATAMAMIMRYYKYPKKGIGSFQYTGGSTGAQTLVLEDHPFDWANILPSYEPGNYNSTQADAVATLMLACGASLNMNYDKDGSGANTAKVNGLLKNNFYYDKSAKYITTETSTNPEQDITYWGEDAVRPNLDNGWPLIFAGYPAVGKTGHCFVIDGYKVVDGMYYYHVNWGWGGHGNSWCLLTRLIDDSGNDYAGHNLQMVYDIYPASQRGIDDVDAQEIVHATKELRNGQIVIHRNNQLYSVQGKLLQ